MGSIIETRALKQKKGSWNISITSTNCVLNPRKASTGCRCFRTAGVSDGNPDFMKFFGSFGVGGKGVFEGEPLDEFGLGFYFMNIANPTIQGPLQTRSFLRDECETSTIAITPWLKLTPSIQIVAAQKHKVTLRGHRRSVPNRR